MDDMTKEAEWFKLMHCIECGWMSKTEPMPWVMVPECPNCTAILHFMHFRDFEIHEVEKELGQEIEFGIN